MVDLLNVLLIDRTLTLRRWRRRKCPSGVSRPRGPLSHPPAPGPQEMAAGAETATSGEVKRAVVEFSRHPLLFSEHLRAPDDPVTAQTMIRRWRRYASNNCLFRSGAALIAFAH
ncbi:hypothetical protein EVAR_101699_1 [Eumeta japonica]|uniref:Uncharacterized protein n=1 Tax=Eumeta variegata TaxID=151549 RepID=A0A4C1TB02_EUMVA|nr:hypothetical protein EVAR_101699_1 [Eumeta japonica]